MPEIQIPSIVITGLQVLLAFSGAFLIALWVSLIIWTFRDVRARSRDIFAILLATLMVVIFGPLGLLLYFLLRPPTTLAELYERSLEEEALLQDLEERPRCPGCSRQVHEAWIMCPDCHTTLKKVCPQCENSLSLQWNICPFCGTQQSARASVDRHDDPYDHTAQRIAAQQTRPMSPPEREPVIMPEPLAGEVTVTTPPSTRSDETRPQYPQTDPA
ncbi:MAG: zinc ribbon domain-containing protein [Chloroflexota bacterium]